MNNKRVFVIGLDCAPPQLVFKEYLNDLPNIKRMVDNGTWGRLKSTIPPITCPAWMSMMTGKNPGKLGCYGLRNRRDYSYYSLAITNSTLIKEDTVWDILSENKKKVIVVGVAQTYPPQAVNGYMVSGFLTPGTNSNYTYPRELKEEIKEAVGEYTIDIKDFRTDDKDYLLDQIYRMTENRFKIVNYLLKNKEWDFFIFVEMGPDRIHHGFWKFADQTHRKYEKGNKYQKAILDYYRYLDQEIGKIDALLDENTIRFIVSDHGAKRLEGGICINEWLLQNGYLKLKEYPREITRCTPEMVDWNETRAWGEGGYFARIFLNVKDREPQGIVERKDYERLRDELSQGLKGIRDERGKDIDTKVFKPEEVYPICNGIPPDLIVYLGNLYFRSIGSVGYNSIWTPENDLGPDDANHDEYGIFVIYDPGNKYSKNIDRDILDIAPTILKKMGIEIPKDMEGSII